jgi:ABC-type molybdate transport system permease subunit
MKNIKISTIVLLTCLLLTFIFDKLVPMWLGISMGAISIIMLVLLNINMKGVIKKLVLYIDAIVGLFLILTFIPHGFINYNVNDFLSHSLVFIFAGLLIAILVNAYKTKNAL